MIDAAAAQTMAAAEKVPSGADRIVGQPAAEAAAAGTKTAEVAGADRAIAAASAAHVTLAAAAAASDRMTNNVEDSSLFVMADFYKASHDTPCPQTCSSQCQ